MSLKQATVFTEHFYIWNCIVLDILKLYCTWYTLVTSMYLKYQYKNKSQILNLDITNFANYIWMYLKHVNIDWFVINYLFLMLQNVFICMTKVKVFQEQQFNILMKFWYSIYSSRSVFVINTCKQYKKKSYNISLPVVKMT